MTTTEIASLAWPESGLLPVVIQDARTGAVLTLAYANREALKRTLATRETHLWSRSRGELWRKGTTSGNVQHVESVSADCDADALLYRVHPAGPACHTGATTCFETALLAGPADVAPGGALARALEHLRATFARRRSASADESYVAKLLAGGVDRIGKKIGEEATEVVIAAKNDDRAELTWEAADLLFHLLLLLEAQGVSPDDVGAELLRRAK